MPASKAVERRLTAIRATVDYILTEQRTAKPGMTREEAIAKIGELAPLGRTDRWKTAIKAWQTIVADEEFHFEWTITQYAIYTAYEAL